MKITPTILTAETLPDIRVRVSCAPLQSPREGDIFRSEMNV